MNAKIPMEKNNGQCLGLGLGWPVGSVEVENEEDVLKEQNVEFNSIKWGVNHPRRELERADKIGAQFISRIQCINNPHMRVATRRRVNYTAKKVSFSSFRDCRDLSSRGSTYD